MTHALTPFLPPADEYRRTVDLATRLAHTAFVPTGLRGQPEAVLAAMLVGRELGIGALEALRSVHVIEGRPTESAELLHALVLRAGHDLYVAESTSERCVVRYRRNGWPANRPDAEVVWTLADAQAAGLAGRGTWSKYPRAMLRSRAVSEAVRQGFPDVVKGAGYTGEELGAPDEVVDQQTAGTVEVADVQRVDPADPPQGLDDDVDEVDRRRALYDRARSAYRRVAASEPDVAAQAWRALTMGLGAQGASAADVFRQADELVLEQRVADLEACADDDGTDPDDGGARPDPDPTPDPGDDGAPGDDDAVDAELVDDDPVEVDDPPAPTATERPNASDRAAWPATNVVDAMAVLKGGTVDVDGHTLDLSGLDDRARRDAVRSLEEALPKGGRRTILAAVGRTAHVPGHERPSKASEVDAGATTPDEGPTPDSGDHGQRAHPFRQPDGMDGAEYATRVGLFRRYEAAAAAVEATGSADAEEALADELRANVGDPGGAMHVDVGDLERLAERAEGIAHRAAGSR